MYIHQTNMYSQVQILELVNNQMLRQSHLIIHQFCGQETNATSTIKKCMYVYVFCSLLFSIDQFAPCNFHLLLSQMVMYRDHSEWRGVGHVFLCSHFALSTNSILPHDFTNQITDHFQSIYKQVTFFLHDLCFTDKFSQKWGCCTPTRLWLQDNHSLHRSYILQ